MPTKASNTRQYWLKSLVAKYGDGDLQAFSERTGIDRTSISLMHNGRRAVSDKMAIRISNKLHVDLPSDMALVAPTSATKSNTTLEGMPELLAAVSRLEQNVTALANAQVMLLSRIDQLLKDRQ